RAPPLRRRREAFALGAAGAAIALFAAVFITTLAVAGGQGDHTTAATLHTWMAWTGVIAVPVSFLLGLLRERLAFASVGDLVRRLESVGPDAVEPALARALQDPTVRVVFLTEGGPVDVGGRPVEPPDDGSAGRLPLGDPPYAMLLHDPALAENRELLDAAVAAAGLALDNARLYAEVRARLNDVMASRQRIARAADAERQRLERDLHDGAQQRLLGIGYMLGALRARLVQPADRQVVGDLETELRGAIGELREFAHGIRPAVLTDQGLEPAVASLARHAGVCVDLYVRVAGRLDPVVEATAYYVVSEALTNVARHTGDARASVSVIREPDRLLIEVADDGPGGASMAAGTGLRAIADSVGAVGGEVRIESPIGGGTRMVADLPCG
ncbi:histidine kinase, partial [Actinoplanes sp. NPDC024001]|uniref:sensor histidine kinase n=1 Tax=Actinoplanes sp. NPDC024001 TaxID=3154598 RepID=UPI0033E70E2D